MTHEALPCIVCGLTLDNCFDSEENQPDGGTAFHTYGHYGSTVFDPMNGTALELNVCDECLLRLGREGKVLWNMRWRPITADGVLVGREWVHRPHVPWDPDVVETEVSDDTLDIEPEQVGVIWADRPNIEWQRRA